MLLSENGQYKWFSSFEDYIAIFGLPPNSFKDNSGALHCEIVLILFDQEGTISVQRQPPQK